MCLSLVTTESPEKQDALSAEFLISLISFFSDTSLVKGLITDYRVASGAKWMDKGAFKAFVGATHWCTNS